MRVIRTLIAIAAVLVPLTASAAPESICPGGASPRSDIDWCADFESYGSGSCTTGQEAGCATANGLDDLIVNVSDDFKIKDCSVSGDGAAVVGTGCVYGSGRAGSTGPGYSDKSSTSSTAAGMRYYVRFGKGWLPPSAGQTNHMPGIKYTGGCTGLVTVDAVASGFGWLVENNGGCTSAASSFAIPNNVVDTFRPKNNHWYSVEMKVVMNTTASGTGWNQGNGVFKAWIDDTLVADYSNINYRGTDAVTTFTGAYGPRSYYGHGVPSWKPNIAFDQFVYSKDGTKIGLASGATAGTADTNAYYNACSYSAYTQKRTSSDCSTTGYDGQCVQSEQWRSAPTWQSGTANNGYPTDCPSTTNKALQASATSGNGSGVGEALQVPVEYTQTVIHGRVYLPSGNSYATAVPLSGFTRYWASTNWDKYVAICRLTNGHVGLCYNNVGTTTTTDTGTSWTTDAWHEYQIEVTSADKISLYWDGSYLLSAATPAQALWTWVSDSASAGPRYAVIGIITYGGSGTYDAYFDDSDVGSSSYVNCNGWDASTCPSGLGGAPTPTPTPTPTPAPTVTTGLSPVTQGRSCVVWY